MGVLGVRSLQEGPEKIAYTHRLLSDIEALQQLLDADLFEKEPIRIGAEQEFCLVDGQWSPTQKAMEVLEEINDLHFTSEIALYNLEINLDPIPLKGNCFSQMHDQLNDLLELAKTAALKHQTKIVLTGILPTIASRHLEMSYMTPMQRYEVLNNTLKNIKGDHFEMYIQGVDELDLKHNSILYEGCNTSFQAHLQINPYEFRDMYNWAQAISAPILAIASNSPMLMGRELWHETRIALFTQSIDIRQTGFLPNTKESRVSFGSDWVWGTVADFFKDSVMEFRSLVTSDFESNSLDELKKGNIPKLKALGLHNGTVYKWNRPCYGVGGGKPHIRIENRYMPSGPTTTDEIANLMLWVGLMQGRPDDAKPIHETMDFRDAKENFVKAARHGMGTQFHWEGKIVPAHELLLNQLLPMAYEGLKRMGVAKSDAKKYLGVIEKRINTQTGATWITSAFRKLCTNHSRSVALKKLTAALYEKTIEGNTVDTWPPPKGDEHHIPEDRKKVRHLMKSKVYALQETDSLEKAIKMMLWKNIRHVPVMNNQMELTGMVSWTDVEHLHMDLDKTKEPLHSIMNTKVITTTPDTLVFEAKNSMAKNRINSLPVINKNKLVGIITASDL